MEKSGVKDPESFPFVLIGNKADKDSKREVDAERGSSGSSKLSKKSKFFEVSAKSGEGVEAALNSVIEFAASQLKEDDLYVAPTLNLNATQSQSKKKKKGCCGK